MHGVVGVSRAGRLLAGLLVALLGGALLVIGSPGLASATSGKDGNDGKVTICHARSATNNPYGPNAQTPNKSSVISEGHSAHTGPVYAEGMHSGWGDIIPPFDYEGGSFAGLNWTAEGQAILNNNCQVPQAPPAPKEISVQAVPSATDPTCDAAGTLVIEKQDGVNFVGAENGAGPGTYTITATADDGYKLTGTTEWTVVVPEKQTGADCAGTRPPADSESRDVKGDPDCTALTVTTEHQTRTREYVLDGSEWVPGEWSDWTNESSETTDADWNACDYFLETSHATSCGTTTISLHNHSAWLYRVLIEVSTDGGATWSRATAEQSSSSWMAAPGVMAVNNAGDAPNDQTGTYTLTFPEDSGTYQVRYKVSSGTEVDLYNGVRGSAALGQFTSYSVESDCQSSGPVEVTPVVPVWNDVCGVDDNGVWNYSDTEAYHYVVDSFSNGKVKIVATANDGYAFPDGATAQWQRIQDNSRCATTPAVDVTPSSCVDHALVNGSLATVGAEGVSYVVHNWVDGEHDGHATVGSLAPGQYLVTASPAAGYELNLTDGWKLSKPSGRATYLVTIADQDCNEYVTPMTPELIQPSCLGEDHVAGSIEQPATTGQIVYRVKEDGLLYAAIQQGVKGYTFFDLDALPAGWAAFDGKAQYLRYTPTYDAAPLCAVGLVEPTVNQPTCDTAGSVTLPADTDTIDYYFHPENGTLVAKARAGFKLAESLPAGWGASSFNRATFTPTYVEVGECRTPVTPENPTVTVSTGCNVDDVLVLPEAAEGYSYRAKWNEDGTHVQVVADAADGYYFDTNGERKVIRTWEFDIRTVANGGINQCADDPAVPTVTVECGVDDVLVVPDETDQFAWEVYPKPDNQQEVKARTKAGFEFTNGKFLRQWTLTVNPAVDCPVETTVDQPDTSTSDDAAPTTPTTVLGSSIEATTSSAVSSVPAESSVATGDSSSEQNVPVNETSVSPRVAGSSIAPAPAAPAAPADPEAPAVTGKVAGSSIPAAAADPAQAPAAAEQPAAPAPAAQAGPPSATAHTGEGSGALPYLLLAGGLLLMFSGLRARRRGNHAA